MSTGSFLLGFKNGRLENMNIYRVSFFGHRYVSDLCRIEEKLDALIRDLIKSREYVEFLVGQNGEFDQAVSSTIRKVQKAYRADNSSHILVLPYMTAELRDNREHFEEYYDEIEINSIAQNSHFKSALQKRNRDMTDRSDMVVFFVEQKSGGAYQTYRYAVKCGKVVINLADTSLQ